jgi:DNA-binding Lrp family transcriptional regulator
MSTRSLSSKLGVSAVTVGNRIRQLIDNRIIAITVVVDPVKAGAPVGVLFALCVNHSAIKTVMDRLSQVPAMARLSVTSGRFNLVATAYFNSIAEMSALRFGLIASDPDIRSCEVIVLLQDTAQAGASMQGFDRLELALIDELREDGRQTITGLAHKLRMNRLTIQRRLNNLIGSGRIRVRALIYDGKVDWYWHGALAIRAKHFLITQVKNELKSFPNVTYVSYTSGSMDLIASVFADSRSALIKVMEEVERISGVTACELFISEEVRYLQQWVKVIKP